MHPVKLISKAIEGHPERPVLPCDPVHGVCSVTGEETTCVPRRLLLSKDFTNGDVLAAPESSLVSTSAYYALKFKWERMGSWFCDGNTFDRLTRQDVRAKVFAPEMPDMWAAYATTSYKKHGSLNTKTNTSASRVWLFEMRIVDLTDMERVSEWWGKLNGALRSGIGRSVLESMVCPPFLIKKIGIDAWMDFEAWAKPKHMSSLYSFLCYLLPSQEELKNEARAKY